MAESRKLCGWGGGGLLVAGALALLAGCGGQVRAPESSGRAGNGAAEVASTGAGDSSTTGPSARPASAAAPASGPRRTPTQVAPPAEIPEIRLTQLSQPRPEGVALPFPGAEVTTDIVPGKRGGTFIYNRFGEGPKTFNLITANDSGSNDVIALMHTALIIFDPYRMEYKPGLAEEYFPDPGDASRWTIRLREGLLWSDGQPITADDVVFAAEAIYNENITTAYRDILKINDQPLKYEALDARTVRVTLPAPSASAISMIGISPLPRHVYGAALAKSAQDFVDAMATDAAPETIVGSGPFRLKRYDRGQRVVLERNPHYYRVDANGTRLPYLDEFVLAYSRDQDQMALAFRENGDALDRPRPDNLPRLLDEQDSRGWTVYDVGPANASSLFFFNLKEGIEEKSGRPHVDPDKLKWFRNRDFREAALRAIDRESIIKAELRGLAVPLHGLTPPAHRGWHNPDVPQYLFNPDKAREMLDAIGLKDTDGDGIREAAPGKPLSVTIVTNKGNKVRETVGLMIANDFKKVGIDARLDTVEWNALLEMTDSTYIFEACLMGLVGGLAHAQGTMNTWPSHSRTNLHNPRQKTPSTPEEARIDELVREFTVASTFERQRTIFHEIQKIHASNVFVLPLWVQNAFYVGRDRIGNWKPTPADDLVWNAAELFVK